MPPPALAITVERCAIELDAMPREIAAAADGSLYVVTASGRVEHHVASGAGCSFARDDAFESPPGGWRAVEATSDGRIYLVKTEAGKAVLSWIGTSSGSCSDTRAYRPVIGASGDGSVVMAPLTGTGLRRITTSPCGATDLVATDEVEHLGRTDAGDIIYGTRMARVRLGAGGSERFRSAVPFAGASTHGLEVLGSAIASWGDGQIHLADAASGADGPAVTWDTDDALFDTAPDGRVGYLVASCASMYRLTP